MPPVSVTSTLLGVRSRRTTPAAWKAATVSVRARARARTLEMGSAGRLVALDQVPQAGGVDVLLDQEGVAALVEHGDEPGVRPRCPASSSIRASWRMARASPLLVVATWGRPSLTTTVSPVWRSAAR